LRHLAFRCAVGQSPDVDVGELDRDHPGERAPVTDSIARTFRAVPRQGSESRHAIGGCCSAAFGAVPWLSPRGAARDTRASASSSKRIGRLHGPPGREQMRPAAGAGRSAAVGRNERWQQRRRAPGTHEDLRRAPSSRLCPPTRAPASVEAPQRPTARRTRRGVPSCVDSSARAYGRVRRSPDSQAP
jgi:hypothetical protein